MWRRRCAGDNFSIKLAVRKDKREENALFREKAVLAMLEEEIPVEMILHFLGSIRNG